MCLLGLLIHLGQLTSFICLIVDWLSIGVIEITGLYVIYYLVGWPGLIHLVNDGIKREQDLMYKHFLSLGLTIFVIVPLVKVRHVTKPRVSVGGDYPRA